MKLKIFTAFLLLATIFSFADTITITGSISGNSLPAVKKAIVKYPGKMFSTDVTDGKFSLEVELDKERFAELYILGNNASVIYLKPGENKNFIIVANSIKDIKITSNESNDLSTKIIDQLNAIGQGFGYKAFYDSKTADKTEDAKEMIAQAQRIIDQNKKALNKQYPNFVSNLEKMLYCFNVYVNVEDMETKAVETELEKIKNSGYDIDVLAIPYFKDYFDDLINVRNADQLDVYGITVNNQDKSGMILKKMYVEQVVKYSPNASFVNQLLYEPLYKEKLINGFKNEDYVAYILDNVTSASYDSYKEEFEKYKIEQAENAKNNTVEKAFNFTLEDLDGQTVTLADFKGKPLFIDFWASWCAPCRAQIPSIKTLEKKYGEEIQFASVNLDTNRDKWKKAVEEEKLTGHILYAEGDFKNPFPANYNIVAIPRFMLIDADGNIINDNTPKPSAEDQIRELFENTLNQGKVTQILNAHLKVMDIEKLKGKMLVTNEEFTLVGLKFKVEAETSIYQNKQKKVSEPENPEQIAQMLGKDAAEPKTEIYVDGDGGYKEGKKLKSESIPVLYGYEIAYLKKAGALFNYNSFDEDLNAYLIDATYNGHVITFYIDATSQKIIRRQSESKNSRRKGGTISVSTYFFTEYSDVEGIPYLSDYSLNSIINTKVKDIEIKLVDESIFKVQ
ncbi:MAG: AhpC/TSA family protein [Ignavibacteriae bacterium]|nr:AhpC/TSA family protein [Ignavibacteriota bacterium]